MQRTIFSVILLAGAIQASAQQWVLEQNKARYVAAASDGTAVAIDQANTNVYWWKDGRWSQLNQVLDCPTATTCVPVQLVSVAVGNANTIWGTDVTNRIWRWVPPGPTGLPTWQRMPGSARQVSVAADGTILGVAPDNIPFRYNASTGQWTNMPGQVKMIAAGSAQEIWCLGLNTQAFRFNTGTNAWDPKPGYLANISVGADNNVQGAGTETKIYKWDPSTPTSWSVQDGMLQQIAIGSSTVIWGVNSGNLYRRSFPAATTSTGVMTVGPTQTITIPTTPTTGTLVSNLPPAPTGPTIVAVAGPTGPGKLICSTYAGSTASCGTMKADVVGAYKLKTTCDSGFYDMLYGGTCWQCPVNTDGRGTWVRGTEPVNKDRACWRSPQEALVAATKVKATYLAGECSSGTFFDLVGGGCYSCPTDYPRRTLYAVTDAKACASPITEEAAANMLAYNGCPASNNLTMKTSGLLPGKSMAGKPFLDIAAGWNGQTASGNCYSCPIVDSEGNFLITSRNENPLYAADNKGCNVLLKYKPGGFQHPGMSGLMVKNRILESRLLDSPELLTRLHSLAYARGMAIDSPEARAWVKAEMTKIAQAPYATDSFRLVLLDMFTVALNTPAASRTPAQTEMVNAMGIYITKWRIYAAQQALDMYDAWNAWNEYSKTLYKHSQLGLLFDYGTVPLDFQSFSQAIAAPAAAGAGLAAGIAGFVRFSSEMDAFEKSRKGLFFILGRGNLIKTAFQGITGAATALTGATAIATAFAIITQVANDQFMAIVTARPKLVANLAAAAVPASADTVYAGTNGADQIQYFWVMATEGTDFMDAQIQQLAVAANQTAAATGYAKPN